MRTWNFQKKSYNKNELHPSPYKGQKAKISLAQHIKHPMVMLQRINKPRRPRLVSRRIRIIQPQGRLGDILPGAARQDSRNVNILGGHRLVNRRKRLGIRPPRAPNMLGERMRVPRDGGLGEAAHRQVVGVPRRGGPRRRRCCDPWRRGCPVCLLQGADLVAVGPGQGELAAWGCWVLRCCCGGGGDWVRRRRRPFWPDEERFVGSEAEGHGRGSEDRTEPDRSLACGEGAEGRFGALWAGDMSKEIWRWALGDPRG